MKNSHLRVGLVASATMFALSSVVAQEDDADAPNISPIEIYTCDYRDGKGMDDLQAVIDNWNAWMDDEGNNDYFAATMTPYYYGSDTFDVAWVGAAKTAEILGAGIDSYSAEGAEHAAAFGSVVECGTHQNVASVTVKQPADSDSDRFVASFSDCSVGDGKSLDDVFSAMDVWTAYQIEQGYQNGTWSWFPVYGGGGDQGFDFKLVESYANHTAMGRDWDKMAGGGYIKSGEIFAGVVSCDTARVYNVTVHRETDSDE